ncbi:hypothetical protein [Alteromonas macleodii]|uniref:Uncharacterized protein n=1 Tax=Alteromonas macleodii TaxID=28108 RepID=A0AB36FMY9_ALTMA|nr:hypothetical protein [Alteromonas macleodii]OES24476.1 hypothetical protein BFV95_4743 [Alteromonas macleodii]OES25533.1 hypothetical protein BFV94_4386 [Alteromonas macleodii]OES25834.1 hypothetical protein BFV93_4297 [Alteromonas macleodii]OES38644.1 hypothetical protein BFV96_4755 [Alteromonas macleodii]
MIVELDIHNVPEKATVDKLIDISDICQQRIDKAMYFMICWVICFLLVLGFFFDFKFSSPYHFGALVAGVAPVFITDWVNDWVFRHWGVKSDFNGRSRSVLYIDMLEDHYATVLAPLCLQHQEIRRYIENVNGQGRQLLLEEFNYLIKYAEHKIQQDLKTMLANLGKNQSISARFTEGNPS